MRALHMMDIPIQWHKHIGVEWNYELT
uniref:Uncharacterized protein n=1 Tax=Lepeophtheirus salmonis TaxID=72036 RepID=A0A0K2V9D5_LEPSM